MADTEITCANRQCRIAQDGKCVEGYDDLGQCPFYGRKPADIEDDEEEVEGEKPDLVDSFDGLHLPESLSLEGAQADRVLAILPSRVIGVIGVHNSGKTSLIAGLFDLFQTGPIAGVTFAGSSTLHGFELICHDARVASERDEPHSERTKRGEVRFYHIDVERRGELESILIADRSGEEYEEVADLTSNAEAMFELRRADVITVLVDGRRLASPVERADAMGAIPLIIQGMIENKAFVRKPNLAVVLTKGDAVQASPRKEKVEQDFSAIVEGIRETFSDHFGELRSFVTSASPKDVNVERGEGLAGVLDFWLNPSVEPRGSRQQFTSGRVFDGLRIRGTDLD